MSKISQVTVLRLSLLMSSPVVVLTNVVHIIEGAGAKAVNVYFVAKDRGEAVIKDIVADAIIDRRI